MMQVTRRATPIAIMAALAAVLLTAGLASAHVTVWPKEAATGAYERYTVRVPTEKDIPTIKVELLFPEGLRVTSVQPKPGWTYEIEKDAAGNTTGIVWSGGQIGPGEFDEFGFVAANPEQPGQLAFKAYQTYADDSVVPWDGPEGSEHPGPVTTVVMGVADDGHDDSVEQPGTPVAQDNTSGIVEVAAATTSADSGPLSQTATFWLSVAALIVGIVAIVLTVFRGSRRPAS